MKHLLGILLITTSFSGPLLAAVVDNFSCQVRYYADKTLFRQKADLSIARHPVSGTPWPGDVMTEGAYHVEFDFEPSDAPKRTVSFTLRYRHIVRSRADGSKIAGQYLCQQGEVGSGHQGIATSCAVVEPFTEGHLNWAAVSFIHDVAAFDPTGLVVYELDKDYLVDCRYLSTQQ
jgi:hypothetical protein